MDRINVFSSVRKFFFFIIYFFVLFSLECIEINNSILPLLPSEINYDYERMIDAEKDNPTDKTSYEYSLEIIKKEKEFLKTCKRLNQKKELIGEWNLVDSYGNEVENYSYYFENQISISLFSSELVLDNWGNRSFIYEGDAERFYILSRGINIIRMIKIYKNELFIYIVKNGSWVLDPIHEGGKYFFKKVDDNEEGKVIDITEFIK